MATVDTDVLIARREAALRLLVGFRTLQTSPDSGIEEDAELAEAITNAELVVSDANNMLQSIQNATNNGFFVPKKEIASREVIAKLKKLSESVTLAVNDFEEPDLSADRLDVTVS